MPCFPQDSAFRRLPGRTLEGRQDDRAKSRIQTLDARDRGTDQFVGSHLAPLDQFGLRNGEMVLADEALTPDSSRYWDCETYEPGRGQDSFDKQIVRDWLEQSGWDKQPPPPDLPAEIVAKAARRYTEIAARLMG